MTVVSYFLAPVSSPQQRPSISVMDMLAKTNETRREGMLRIMSDGRRAYGTLLLPHKSAPESKRKGLQEARHPCRGSARDLEVFS
jgi:hypothetical protein